MSDKPNIRSWFDSNVAGGLSKYLVEVSRDIEEVEQAASRAKLKLDFIKMVEQVLGTLDHLYVDTGDKEVTFVFDEISEEEINSHWDPDANEED